MDTKSYLMVRGGTMRNAISGGVRRVVLPTLACSLVCGGAVAVLAATGVRALDTPATAAPVRAAAGAAGGMTDGDTALPPPGAVVVRTPPTPTITTAPTATVWVVRLTPGRP
jgi:hypothetical protein